MPKIKYLRGVQMRDFTKFEISTKRHPNSTLILDDGVLEQLIDEHGITSIWPAKIGDGKRPYAITYTKEKKREYIHRLILPNVKIIDHINQDPLDNRLKNLRPTSASHNATNKAKRSDNTSGVTGVYWSKERKKWLAMISINKKLKLMGTFKSKNEAIKCRKSAEIKYYGDHRCK